MKTQLFTLIHYLAIQRAIAPLNDGIYKKENKVLELFNYITMQGASTPLHGDIKS